MRHLLIYLLEAEAELLENARGAQQYLALKYPEQAGQIAALPPKYQVWLSDRYGEKPRYRETHPLGDALPTLRRYAGRDSALSTKYKSNEQFRSAVDAEFPLRERGWQNPSDVTKMTADQMERVLVLATVEKQRFAVDADEKSLERDRVGKVGPWNLWLPTSRETSCEIAGYDKDTKKPKTTWCTARMSGSNLFYNYVGSKDANALLFYVIKDDPSGDEDWLSVGFLNGEIELSGKHGGISVDRKNDGLTEKRLRGILGGHYERIVSILTKKSEELGGKSPAREKLVVAAQNVSAFRSLISGLGTEERIDLIRSIVAQGATSPEVAWEIYLKFSLDILKGQVAYAVIEELESMVRELLSRTSDQSILREAFLRDAFSSELTGLVRQNPNYISPGSDLATLNAYMKVTMPWGDMDLTPSPTNHQLTKFFLRVLEDGALVSEEVVEYIVGFGKGILRPWLASRTSNPRALDLLAFYAEFDPNVALELRRNPRLSPEILDKLAKMVKDPRVARELEMKALLMRWERDQARP